MVLEVRGSHHPRGVSTWSLAAGLGGLASCAGRSGLTQGLCLRVWYAPIKRLKTPKAGGVCIFTETFTEYLPCSGSLLGRREKGCVLNQEELRATVGRQGSVTRVLERGQARPGLPILTLLWESRNREGCPAQGSTPQFHRCGSTRCAREAMPGRSPRRWNALDRELGAGAGQQAWNLEANDAQAWICFGVTQRAS